MALTRKRVMEWLDALDPEVVCGTAGEPGCCPLASFLMWDGASAPRVGLHQYNRNRHLTMERPRLLPLWADKARETVDNGFRGGFRSVRAREFRQVMEKVL